MRNDNKEFWVFVLSVWGWSYIHRSNHDTTQNCSKNWSVFSMSFIHLPPIPVFDRGSCWSRSQGSNGRQQGPHERQTTIQAHTHTYGQFSVTISCQHAFGGGRGPHRHGEKQKTPRPGDELGFFLLWDNGEPQRRLLLLKLFIQNYVYCIFSEFWHFSCAL